MNNLYIWKLSRVHFPKLFPGVTEKPYKTLPLQTFAYSIELVLIEVLELFSS